VENFNGKILSEKRDTGVLSDNHPRGGGKFLNGHVKARSQSILSFKGPRQTREDAPKKVENLSTTWLEERRKNVWKRLR